MTQWLGMFFGTIRYFECLHTCDDGFPGTVSVERYGVLRAQAVAVGDLYDAYVAAEIAANDCSATTPAEEEHAVSLWAQMKQQVIDRHNADQYTQSLRWILNPTEAPTS